MKSRNILLLIAVIVFVTVSCSKEKSEENGNPAGGTPTDTIPRPGDTTGTNPGNVTSEVGTWNFISVQVTGTQTAEFSQAGIPLKAANNSDFTSGNNGGTITFDSSVMTATDITFAFNTNTTTYIYQGNTLLDSVNMPVNQTFPPQSATSNYERIGADSLHFQDSGFLDALTGGFLPNAPTGCKVSFSGNTMKMTIVYDGVTSQDYQGIPAKVTAHEVMVVTLEKQ